MKRTLLIFLLFPHVIWAQYHFDFENRSTSPFEQVPAERWECSNAGVISGSYSLHHNYDNPEAGTDYCFFRHDPYIDTDSLSLSFRIRHAHAPSSANNWQVALLADFSKGGNAGPNGSGERDTGANGSGRITKGIVLGVNFTGSDDYVKLWEIRAGRTELRGKTRINYQDQIGTGTAPFFRVAWENNGELKLYITRNPDQHPEMLAGIFQLDSLPDGRHLIFRYEYSSAQDRNLWIDDIALLGTFIPDTSAPVITGIRTVDSLHLRLDFSEEIEIPFKEDFHMGSLTGNKAKLEQEILPDSVMLRDRGLLLRFPVPIPNRVDMGLYVEGISDADGNCLADTLLSFMRNEAEWGDVVFTEIMYDPDPMVGLPGEEYLEIYNRSPFGLELEGWWCETDNRRTKLSATAIDPDQYLVLTGISLPNDGATLALYNPEGTLIHAARYNQPWNGPEWKREGGWSLESPDPEMICKVSDIWEYSEDPEGGTPGYINSNHCFLEDREAPRLLYTGFGGPETILVRYSEPVRILPGTMIDFKLVPGGKHPDSLIPVLPLSEELKIYFKDGLPQISSYELHLPEISDCAGNLSHPVEIRAGLCGDVRSGGIQINEIMYDPWDNAPEYIELFNGSQRCFDLQDLSLSVVKTDLPLSYLWPLTAYSRILAPGDYLVITRCTGKLMNAYFLEPSGRWLERDRIPELPNTGGTIYLTDRAGAVVDMAHYGDHLHMDLLNETKGISLERISAEKPGTDPGNWHSAASIEGYATPGRVNSQSVPESGVLTGELLSIEPEVFSPDNDGFQDLLRITIETGKEGSVIRLLITDLTGTRVRYLANNQIVGPISYYSWDGESDHQKMVPEGIYVVHLWVHDPATGQNRSQKRATGIIYR